jgi:hypothetical protein
MSTPAPAGSVRPLVVYAAARSEFEACAPRDWGSQKVMADLMNSLPLTEHGWVFPFDAEPIKGGCINGGRHWRVKRVGAGHDDGR